MARVEIYTSPFCGFCHRAKALLDRKGVDYEETDVMVHPKKREEMRARTGGRNSVPQIFIDDQNIGGCDDLHKLEADGELDALLGAR